MTIRAIVALFIWLSFVIERLSLMLISRLPVVLDKIVITSVMDHGLDLNLWLGRQAISLR